MKLLTLVCALVAFTCLFSSCQKEIDDTITGTDSTAVNNSFLVKTYTEDLYAVAAPDEHVKDSFTLSYDNKGRLLSLISITSPDSSRFLYQYNADNTFTLNQYYGSELALHEIIYLNNLNYVDSTRQDDQEGDTTTEKYIYDSGKKLTHLYTYDYTTEGGSVLSGTDTYEYDNMGNVIKTTSDGAVTAYDYSSNTVNNLNIGLNYYQQSKYLPDSFTYTSGNDVETGTHIYTFDSQNRLVKDVATTSNGYVAVKTYGY